MSVLINRSHEADWVIRGWLTRAGALAKAKLVVSLPDTCPGKAPLPTGTGYLTDASDWRRFAVSDVGCGLCLVRSGLKGVDAATEGFRDQWRALCETMRARRNRGLGDLGSGNHFLDAAVSSTDGSVCFVVHTGSRKESGIVDDLVNNPGAFDAAFSRAERWAFENRAAVLEMVEKQFGRFVPLYRGVDRLDRNHNHFEETDAGVVIRKGAQRVRPGELALIPSNLLDEMAVVRARPAVAEHLMCLPHGTGRAVSRSDAKRLDTAGSLAELRARVFIPESIEDSSLRTETPECYRSLAPALERIADLVEEVERFVPVAYIGQL
ncbi:MAG TPA: RtcB family protein [Phycisphaerales bacterium]|nr:RtcB family protein [Phycisphaerales bacterium]